MVSAGTISLFPFSGMFVALTRRFRRVMAALPVAVLAAAALPVQADTALPPVRNLQQSVELAASRHQPLIVMFSLPDCPYCEKLRRTQYQFLARDGYLVQQVEISDRRPVTGFDGRPTSGAELARKYGIKLAPTVLFFGPGGREIGERIVGAMTEDFYGAFIQRAIKESSAALAGPHAGPPA